MTITGVTATPTWCPWGTYNTLGMTSTNAGCTDCPLGSICPGDNLAPHSCSSTAYGTSALSSKYGWNSKVKEYHCYKNILSYPNTLTAINAGDPSPNNWDKLLVGGKLGMPG
jgi:hypothetical protein